MKFRLIVFTFGALVALSSCSNGSQASQGPSTGSSPELTTRAIAPSPASGAAAARSTEGSTTVIATLIATDQGTVTKVVDGDTIHAKFGDVTETIRLIGINTPETVDPRKPVQCFGAEAKARMKALLPVGTVIRLERDAEARDKYGRLLAYVYRVSDNAFINITMAQEGFADVMTIAPNVAHAEEFVAAVRLARDAGVGLWSSCESFGATVTT